MTQLPLLTHTTQFEHLSATKIGYNNTTLLWPFVRNYSSEPVPEETLTHSHLSWLSTILYQPPPSTTIYSILRSIYVLDRLFCTTSLQVLFGLPLGLEPSNSCSIHFFIQ